MAAPAAAPEPAVRATRTGGRSARVQASVHEAVTALLAEHAREQVTVPMIAARAGVTPSTIYRRWGDLAELLADVAVQRLRPEHAPPDTGGLHGDLRAWVAQFVEEMSSEPGRALIRDVLAAAAGGSSAATCLQFTAGQIGEMVGRAQGRGERTPSVSEVVDRVVAPIIYRLLFSAGDEVTPAYGQALVETLPLARDKPAAGKTAVKPPVTSSR